VCGELALAEAMDNSSDRQRSDDDDDGDVES
jgi:hypothetical protein